MGSWLAGDFWILGYRNNETQPSNTQLTGSTIVAANTNYDWGNTGKTNGIVFYGSCPIQEVGDQLIMAKASEFIANPKPGGGTANIGFYRSPSEDAQDNLNLVNYLDRLEGGGGTFTNLNDGLDHLASVGYWNSSTTDVTPNKIL